MRDWAGVAEERLAVDALSDHGASLRGLKVETFRLPRVVNHFLAHHGASLGRVNWQEAHSSELIVPRSHDVLGLDGGRQS